MNTFYGEIPLETIIKQKKYFYGSIIALLYYKEENYPLIDQRIQTLINQIRGSFNLFNNDVKVLSVIAWLEDARLHPNQFRKDILDAANMIDSLGGVPNV